MPIKAASILFVAAVATAIAQPEFQPVNAWVTEPGARSSVAGDIVRVQRGTIRTDRLYSDFVLRFEFRFVDPASEGHVFVRSRFNYDTPPVHYGYRVELTNRTGTGDALGQVSGLGQKLQVVEFHPASTATFGKEWQHCEVRVERSRLVVRINDVLVTSAEDLDEFTGYIGLQVDRGEIDFRNLKAVRQPSAGEPFGEGVSRLSAGGFVAPKALKTAKPFYPREPFGKRIQGAVLLELVLDSTGLPTDIRVVKSVDPDLDEAAIGSARKWRFSPATKSGQPVPVIVTLEQAFTIRD